LAEAARYQFAIVVGLLRCAATSNPPDDIDAIDVGAHAHQMRRQELRQQLARVSARETGAL
jgi:hypothetical protein